MTPFEFVFALISIITSLALTRIITGVVAIIRHRDRGGFSVSHAMWLWIGFAVVLGNWGALWDARVDPDWPAIRVLGWMTSMTSLYAFCALVVPEVDSGRRLDLHQFHAEEGRRYIAAHNLFALLAMLLVIILDGINPDSMPLIVPPVVALGLGLVAQFSRGRVQFAVTVPLVVLATGFMLLNIGIDPA